MSSTADDQVFKAATFAAALRANRASSSNTMQLGLTPDSSEAELNDSRDWSSEMCGLMEVPHSLRQPMDYPHHKWTDITKEFFSACAELEQGELAQETNFGLFEAMSAIEMMDPKMDVGMGYNKEDKTPRTFDACVEAGVLKIADLTPEELIGIMDAVFACLVSWLEGNSIDQTLFTCLYLHKPAGIADKTLQSFCLAIRNLITLIKNIVLQSSVNEEEDFHLYGNNALLAGNDQQSGQIAVQLKAAEDELGRYLKTISEENTINNIKAVVHRLRFMRHFFQSIYQFDVATETSTEERIIEEVKRNLNPASELIPLVRSSIERGTQPVEGSELPNPMGFSMRVHDRTQPPTFPRTVKIRNRTLSYQFLEELVQRLKYTCKIIKMRDYHSAFNFFVEFSQKYGHCILSRSVLQNLFCSSRRRVFGTIVVQEFLWDSIRSFSNPPVLNTKFPIISNLSVIHGHVENFLRNTNTINTFMQLIRICGFNRARQREKLARCIESFETVQTEATHLDQYLNDLSEKTAVDLESMALKHSTQFATWTLYNCFRAMLMYLMSGFELELYAVHEYIYIYWYPYEMLIGFIVSALTRTENNLLAMEDFMEKKMIVAGKGKKPQQKSKKNKKVNKPYREEIIYYHGLLSLCGGFYKAMAALTKDGRIRQPMQHFDNEQIRFNHRFAPFGYLTTPPQATYAEFKSIRDHLMKVATADVYTIASKHFDQARHVLTSIANQDDEVLSMIQVAKLNYVSMSVFAKGFDKDYKISFDFSIHAHFPAIKIIN